MKYIRLTQDKLAIVDDTDFDALTKRGWYFHNGYAVRHALKHHKMTLMHRVILGASKGTEVDHINGDGLDNRRANLRLCSPHNNKKNRRINRNNTTGFKGVTFHKKAKKYQSVIEALGVSTYLGLFNSAEEAHDAYILAAKDLHGEFANCGTGPITSNP